MTNIQKKSSKKLTEKSLLVNTRESVAKKVEKLLLQTNKHKLREQFQELHKIGKLILNKKENNQRTQGLKLYFNHQYCGLPNREIVKIVKANKGKFMYQNLASCSMIWRCPICSIKILQGRNEEINTILNAHISKGYKVGFVTLTIRHQKSDSYKYTFDKLNNSYRKLQQQKEFNQLKKINLYEGQIKSLETTHSFKNGWHPHLHMLYFYNTNDKNKIESFQKSIISKWAKITNSLVKRQDQSIIKNPKQIKQYIAKFDIVKEITGDFSKTSKGIKPFQLLGSIAEKTILPGTKTIKESRQLAIKLWVEYIETTKGKTRILISPKLKALYNLEEKTDEQLTKQIDVENILVKMSNQIMQSVIKNDLKAELINICYDYEDSPEQQKEEIFKQIQEIEYVQKQILSDKSILITLNQNN